MVNYLEKFENGKIWYYKILEMSVFKFKCWKDEECKFNYCSEKYRKFFVNFFMM